MKRASVCIFLLIVATAAEGLAQCEVTASVAPSEVVCGDCATLTAFGRGQGNQVFSDNFNSGSFSPGWGSTVQAMFTNPCSPNGVDGTTHVWMGNSSPVPRFIRTQAYNLTSATAGVTICFDLLFAEQTGDPATAPCEGPDEPDEGVYLQYSTDGGNTWNTIHYFDPNGGSDPQLINWNNWCFQLPPAAITTQTQIRFFQDFDSGADYDHWGIDNFVIYYNDPTYQIIWLHDGYNYGMGSSGGANPNPVCPQSVTDYVVQMSNGIHTCRDTVRLQVVSPTITIDAGNDTTICLGDCVTLHATARVIKRPAKTPTYRNGEVVPVPTVFGTTGSININITDLNMTTVQPGSITQVCIENLTFFGFNFFPPQQLTVGDLNVYLVCPDGTRILLIPSGVTTSTQAIQGYVNTCFTPVSTANIGASSPPYTGNFAPNQPFSNLNGCTANGVWSIEITPASSLGFGFGFFYGWSITFNDPEISYTANFSWNPTSNMTNANTLSPTVCPSATTTYTLTASDTAGCINAMDAVTVTVNPSCCQLDFTASITSPSCSAPDGAINLTVLSGSGNYLFAWSTGQNTEDLSNLIAGTYTVTVTDILANCQRDTSFTLTNPNAPQITSIATTNESCQGLQDGSATVMASGGSGALTFIWSHGPSGPGLSSVSNLAPGSYSVTVEDTAFCFDVDSFTINTGAVCCTLQLASTTTLPACGQADGSIQLTVVGSGNYSFLWNTGDTTQNLVNIPAGSYSVTVTDLAQNCQQNTLVNLSNPNAPQINNMGATAENCRGSNDGAATVVAIGAGPLTYLWNTGDTTVTITQLTPGIYSVTVTDINNCQAIGSILVNQGPVCCTLSATVVTADASCSGNDGTITVIVDSATGVAPFTFSIDGSNFSSGNLFANLAAGSYRVIARDSNQCADTSMVVINQAGNTITLTAAATAVSCHGNNDGMAWVQITGGNPPLSIQWSNGQTQDTLTGLAAGTYRVTVTDSTQCFRTDSVIITEPPPFTFELGLDIGVCADSSIIIGGGIPAATFLWSTGETAPTIQPAQTGTYTLTATNASNCSWTDSITVTFFDIPQIDAGPDTAILDYETIQLQATSNGNSGQFQWQPVQSLSCSTCANPIASPASTTTYTVTYTDANGCTASDAVTVTVLQAEYYALVPNAFTPNGDGINDVVTIFHKGVKQINLKIFNRWGEKIFETTEPDAVWDGTYQGKKLNPDVLVYYLFAEFMNGRTYAAKGSLTLIR
ncbi:MAG: hypothetical protein KatS3mg031_1974 [Chitinophagales bacterium]|nr:MAG: hypothetical protein KatS3mg031_1974 [Chitinophagales bacterium]